MINDLLLAFASLFFLVRGSDFFIESAARLARRAGISEFVIGLTLVAFGTSLPELVSSVAATYFGMSQLAIGNVIGSNICNICLILGLAAVIKPLKTKSEMFDRDGLYVAASAILFYVLLSDGQISKFDGFVLLSVFFIYLSELFKFRPRLYLVFNFEATLHHFIKLKDVISHTRYFRIREKFDFGRIVEKFTHEFVSTIFDFVVVVVSSFAIYLGGKHLVLSGTSIATRLGMPISLIGLTLVAFGTSVPELIVSITALKKGFHNILIGNIIGSNITNFLLVLGASSLISPILANALILDYTLPLVVVISVLFLLFLRSDWEIRRFEGILFLLTYAGFIYWLATTGATLPQ